MATEITSLEELTAVYPDAESARKYFSQIRWGQWAQCPYCGNEKAYFIENGTRYKCANKACYKKFSCTVKTVLECTNISYDKWLKIIFLYAKTRGRIGGFELAHNAEISEKTEFTVRDRLLFVWNNIEREGKTTMQLVEEIIKRCSLDYHQFNALKSQPHYKNPYHLSEIDNIGDKRQYNLLHRYTRYYINVYAHWIWMDFATAEDILAETFLWMSDNKVKEYNTESLLKYIWRTVDRMWVAFLKAHPKHNESMRIKGRNHKREGRRKLSTTYIVETIKKTKEGNALTRKEIRRDITKINEKRESIKTHRGANDLSEFNSHFD